MASTLGQVLSAFEAADRPLTLGALARELGVAPGILAGMIEHWVRKGRLREIGGTTACRTCAGASGCPFLTTDLPRRFVLTSPHDDGSASLPDLPCGQAMPGS
ncbi:MAG: hypothetical protein JW910_07300 [Anaerolineae bacterium]|nr:hypothetical protein [Anaerolineae bacterium]